MLNRKLTSTIFLLLFCLVSAVTAAAETYDYMDEAGFSITLPNGFGEISESLLDKINAGARPGETFDYGFAPGGRLGIPYLLILTNYDGKQAEPTDAALMNEF